MCVVGSIYSALDKVAKAKKKSLMSLYIYIYVYTSICRYAGDCVGGLREHDGFSRALIFHPIDIHTRSVSNDNHHTGIGSLTSVYTSLLRMLTSNHLRPWVPTSNQAKPSSLFSVL